jgi:hypothetical protein
MKKLGYFKYNFHLFSCPVRENQGYFFIIFICSYKNRPNSTSNNLVKKCTRSYTISIYIHHFLERINNSIGLS